jgi:NADH:ubiquinone oxidoreductase subunit 2 (subunit N)
MTTYEIIQKAHSGWAYLVLAFLLIAVINAFVGLSFKNEFTGKDKKIALFALIFTHIQLVFGLVLYFVSPVGKAVLGEMKDPTLRLTSLEHPLINIIAIILITVGWSKHKKQTTSNAKFKSFAIFYTIGLILILSRIPWKMWLN